MTEDAQVQTDIADTTPVVDPLDATNSPNGAMSELAAYEAERAALLNETITDQTQGEQSAEEVEEEFQEQFDPDASNEAEQEEQEEAEQEQEAQSSTSRFRFKSAEDQAVAALAKGKGISLVEAARIYAGAETPQATEQAPQQQEAAAQSETVLAVEEEIAALKARKKEMLSSLDIEGADEIQDQIDDLKDKKADLRISEAQAKAQAAQAEQEAYVAKYEQSEDKVLQFYPEAGVAGTPINAEMVRLYNQMVELGDPVLNNPDRPMILAREAAANLGIPMKKTGSAPAKPAVTHRPVFQPAGGNARTSPTDTPQAFAQDLDNVTSLEAYENRFRRGA